MLSNGEGPAGGERFLGLAKTVDQDIMDKDKMAMFKVGLQGKII